MLNLSTSKLTNKTFKYKKKHQVANLYKYITINTFQIWSANTLILYIFTQL